MSTHEPVPEVSSRSSMKLGRSPPRAGLASSSGAPGLYFEAVINFWCASSFAACQTALLPAAMISSKLMPLSDSPLPITINSTSQPYNCPQSKGCGYKAVISVPPGSQVSASIFNVAYNPTGAQVAVQIQMVVS